MTVSVDEINIILAIKVYWLLKEKKLNSCLWEKLNRNSLRYNTDKLKHRQINDKKNILKILHYLYTILLLLYVITSNNISRCSITFFHLSSLKPQNLLFSNPENFSSGTIHTSQKVCLKLILTRPMTGQAGELPKSKKNGFPPDIFRLPENRGPGARPWLWTWIV